MASTVNQDDPSPTATMPDGRQVPERVNDAAQAVVLRIPDMPTGRPELLEFGAHLLGLGRSPRTVRTYVFSILRIERAIGKRIGDVVVMDVVLFRSLDLPPSTTQLTITAVKAYHRFGIERGYWDSSSGVMFVASPKRERNPSPWLTPSDAAALLEAVRTPVQARLCYLGLYAGCRVSESAAMGPDNLLGDRLSFVGKGRKRREVPLHPELASQLPRIFGYQVKNERRLQDCRRLMIKRTGIAFHPHMLRSTFAHVLEEADVDHDVRAALLGHAATVTMGYSGVSWRRKQDAISRLHY